MEHLTFFVQAFVGIVAAGLILVVFWYCCSLLTNDDSTVLSVLGFLGAAAILAAVITAMAWK